MLSAQITYVEDLQFIGIPSSGHAVVMDGGESSGGRNSGASPSELLLLGLGGCSGMDVISILKKKRQAVSGFSISVRGKSAEEYPKKFTDIEIVFSVKGKNISEEAVKKAIDLSMNKYCSVKATLEGSAKISYSYEIVQEA
jgi:putative redox protein